jgi:hypothetical protein
VSHAVKKDGFISHLSVKNLLIVQRQTVAERAELLLNDLGTTIHMGICTQTLARINIMLYVIMVYKLLQMLPMSN